MTTPQRPSILRTFMTHDMSDEDIVAVSTGREEEFRRIMGAIDRSVAAVPGTLQHVVLYGSRGFGKSFMMRRVQIALGKGEHGGTPVRFLLLPEEQHNLQKSPHAFLDYISVLLSKSDGDVMFADAMFQWPKPGEARKRWEESAARLEAALDSALPGGKGLVIVAVENFDILLATLFADEEDEQRLREWLFRQKNRVMLLATATGTVDMDYDGPLFHAFDAVWLTPWTTDDCIAYFNRKRESEGKPPLDPRQEAKARAVAEFIGGTPRLAQLLADVIDTEDALSVAETMDALADRLAEYYRRRIEDLGPLVRGLLDALIRGGEPASQTQLAERVGADGQSQIARAMADLQRADIIRGRPAPDSRETLYAVTDRVFAHYYRRRQGSQVARGTPLATILDFLRSFYSRDEQRAHGLRHLLDGRPAEGALLSRLAMEGAETRKSSFVVRFKARLRTYLSAAPDSFADADALAVQLASEPEQVLQGHRSVRDETPVEGAIRAALRAQALFRLSHIGEAERQLQTALAASGDSVAAHGICVSELVSFQSHIRNQNEAAANLGLTLLGRDLQALPEHLACWLLGLIGWSLGNVGRYGEALETLDRALVLVRQLGEKGEELIYLGHTGWSLGQLDRYQEALETLERALVLARQLGDRGKEAEYSRHAGWTLGQIGRHAEALETLARASDLARQSEESDEEVVSLRHTGWSLGQLGRHAEALETLTRASELARHLGDDEEWCRIIATALDSAIHVPMAGVSGKFAEWVRLAHSKGGEAMPEPQLFQVEFLIAAARADELGQADAIIAEHGDWLTGESPWYVLAEHGAALAEIAAVSGRAAGWQAMAGVLPRLARLQALTPEEHRDRTWLSDLITGFAKACRDPGLLRDVADLLTPDLSPEAEDSAALLQDLARVDETDAPETVLARLDPDRALLIRRLRDLPEPEPLRPPKRGRSKRR